MSNQRRNKFLKTRPHFLERKKQRTELRLMQIKEETIDYRRRERLRKEYLLEGGRDPLIDYDCYPRITRQLQIIEGKKPVKKPIFYYLLHHRKQQSKFLCSDAYNNKSRIFLLVFFRVKTLRKYYLKYCQKLHLKVLRIREDKFQAFLRGWFEGEEKSPLNVGYSGIGIVANGEIPIIDYKWVLKRIVEVDRVEEEVREYEYQELAD